MWQKVYNFCLDKYIPLKNLYKFSLIYKHKCAHLKPKKKVNLEKVSLESKLILRKKQTEKISLPILQRRVGPMRSSVFWNANTYLSEIFYFNIS